MNHNFLDQVIPPTQDAIEEYSRRPLDLSKFDFQKKKNLLEFKLKFK